MSTNLNIRVPKQLLADFDKACQDNYTNKSEVLRRAMLEYVRGNKKEEGKVTKELTFEEMVEQARERVTGSDYVKLMDKARHAATDSGIFTDDKESWDENSQYLVEDMEDVVRAFCDDYSIEKVFGVDPAEADDGAEAFCKRHGIRILG